jgi:hypothetical protein
LSESEWGWASLLQCIVAFVGLASEGGLRKKKWVVNPFFPNGSQTLVWVRESECKAGDEAPAHNPKQLILAKFPGVSAEIDPIKT